MNNLFTNNLFIFTFRFAIVVIVIYNKSSKNCPDIISKYIDLKIKMENYHNQKPESVQEQLTMATIWLESAVQPVI